MEQSNGLKLELGEQSMPLFSKFCSYYQTMTKLKILLIDSMIEAMIASDLSVSNFIIWNPVVVLVFYRCVCK